jgi:long-chain acyl-CoA synthetase
MVVDMRRFEEFLQRNAIERPGKTAVAVSGRSLTYKDWNDASDRFADALTSRGVNRGDRVVIVLENSIECAIAIFGVLKAGCVFSVINPTTKKDKLAFVLNNCRARVIVSHEKLLQHVAPAVEQAQSVEVRIVVDSCSPPLTWEGFDRIIEGSVADASQERGLSLDLAMIIYTSGSTGSPKGVMMTHENIDAASWSITSYLENTDKDVILSTLPLSFDYGLYQLLMSCRVGGTVVLEKSFTYPAAVLERLENWQATGFPIVPTMAALLSQLKQNSVRDLSCVRYITNTAAALPPSHISRLEKLFPGTRLYSMYGLTECKRCTYLPPSELSRRPTSVGKAIPGTEAFVLNDSGKRIEPGEVGTLYIRGRTVMQGYWENPEETAKMLKPGPYPWEKVLCTNDLFTIDEDGFLYFVGRSDDIIKTRGEKVSPREVESALYGIDGVVEALVIGEPDNVLGEVIKAFIVLSPESDVTEQDVLRHCASNLEAFMVPKSVEFRQSLPKTDSGKLRRAGL